MVCLALMAGSVFAGDIGWIGGTSGNWANGGNWYGGNVPGSVDRALVNSGGNSTIDSDVGTIASTLCMNGGSTMVVNLTTGGTLWCSS